jgi:protein-tyrosine phosphatase
VDIHTHLLPGVDDGARDVHEALELCRRAVADRTGTVVLTPHSQPRGDLPAAGATASRALEAHARALRAALVADGIELELATGMEIEVDPDLAASATELVTLAGSRYVLLELPTMLVPPGLPDLLFRLQQAGRVPVIAHPERNLAIVERPDILFDLVSRGCLAQVTAHSVTGAFGRDVQRAAETLIRAQLAQVIASDAHWWPERPTGLAAAVAVASQWTGEAQAVAMATTVPAAILQDRPVAGFTPRRPSRRSWWRLQ